MKPLKVLVNCEYSGRVRDAFRALGHDAWSCDLLPTEQNGPHILGDAITALERERWDLMIAHPPCTYLANSGVRWLKDPARWPLLDEAATFFRAMLEANIPHIAVENPIMHGHGVKRVGRKQDQVVQPWMFGHGETKATCLWLKNLPLLVPTNVVSGREQRVHLMPPGPDRWKERSRTYKGIAQAMATQWSQYILDGPTVQNI